MDKVKHRWFKKIVGRWHKFWFNHYADLYAAGYKEAEKKVDYHGNLWFAHDKALERKKWNG